MQPLPLALPRAVRRDRHRRPALRIGQRRPALCRHGALAAALLRAAGDACSITCRAPGSRSITRRRRCAATGSRRSPISTPRGTTSRRRRAPARRSIARSGPSSSISTTREWQAALHGRPVVQLSPFAAGSERRRRIRRRRPPGAAISPPSAPTRTSCCSRRCATISTPSAKPAARPRSPPSAQGSADRLLTVLRERGVTDLRRVADGEALEALPRSAVGLAILPVEQGFATDDAGAARRAGHPRRPARAHAAPAAQPRPVHHRGDEPRRRAISSSMPSTASAATRRWRRSMSPARRTIACACSMPATTGCSCRSRTSRCCRASARKTPARSSTGSAGSPGSRARRGSRSASATSPAN